MKLNLVIDASGIFYRSLFTVGNYGTKKGQRLLESDDSKGVFMRKLATDFAALVKSVESVYSEEWVKLDKNTPPVPMYVDVTSQLELSQIAGLTDFANSGNVIQINFADVPNEKKKN